MTAWPKSERGGFVLCPKCGAEVLDVALQKIKHTKGAICAQRVADREEREKARVLKREPVR